MAVGLIATFAAGCGSEDGAPSSGGAQSLVIGTRNASVPQATVYWAAAKGYFKDAGIDLKISVGEASQTAQLVSGQTDLYFGSQGALFGSVQAGKPIKTIYGVDAGISGYVVASNDAIKTPADCKTVTSATPGTVIYAWTKQLEKVYDVEWKLTQLTDVPSILANVASGRTDCAVGSVTYFQSGIDEGKLRVVLDPTDEANLPEGWPELGVEDVIGGLPDTLKKNSGAVEAFLKAYDEALAVYLKTDAKEIAQTLIDFDSRFAAVGSVDVLAKAIEQFRPLLSPDHGYVADDRWSNTLAFFEQGGLDFIGGDSSKFSYGERVDMSYYEAGIGKP
jgi:ABC-type nitrate/sulfonate/bicarbonate transport system substrate-binding protein